MIAEVGIDGQLVELDGMLVQLLLPIHVDEPRVLRAIAPGKDVDFDAVACVASAITPVPGGVGAMTVAALMHNTLTAARAGLSPLRTA